MAKSREEYVPDVDPETGEVIEPDYDSAPVELVEVEVNDFERAITENSALPDVSALAGEDGVVELKSIRRVMGLPTTHMTPRDISGRPIVIIAMKRIDSDLPGPGYFYLCMAQFDGETDRFTVPIGGQIALPILTMYSKLDPMPPLRVTLNYHSGGKFEGYYTLD